ncbi:Zn-binding Pro-Ala-Ala-Arg (PAAR) domain-containing protein, incolved in TypeVI secretion [Duganella sacchari]|uniref:Zn-binding Pro-Ala-Ala-Arg (PAAR) domain-containing protein, incolved in TypeVI secretion n=1 Tax=Duganella sacchari TaxID=551987 RepID=A0A1M7R1F1_9BURK|nr:PAAR domain-containing protein [Duganella sacchari]SHN38517.1 Zn-binding Pro-Ala-Ala-Arg (PAAR) domain-containing protein, incolved in TypeVI secretion [Duganella sacchari]
MQRYTITLGASTSAGGKVISASSQGAINGIAIALENDLIFCPACKTTGKILCVGPRIPETWNGQQVALEGDLCFCGCSPSPRLIPCQTLRSQVIAEVAAETGLSNEDTIGAASDSGYDLDFLIIDEQSGSPAIGWPYSIELTDGLFLNGKTDGAGRTTRIASVRMVDAILRVYAPEVAPVNPLWDR